MDCRRGFCVSGRHPIENVEWFYDKKNSTESKIVYLAYDANCYPLSDLSTWKSKEHRDKQVEVALKFTNEFNGEVWLDDIRIK